MMAKRILSLLLVLCLMLPLAPKASAGQLTGPSLTPEPVVVSAWQDGPLRISAYRYGEDLLFSAEDLARLSGYSLQITKDEIIFTRGIKVVRAMVDTNVILAMQNEQGYQMNSSVKLIDGKYYLSASSLLSWLNMNCYVKDRTLYLMPTPISFWDLIGEYQPARFNFSMAECARLMLCSEKDLEALAYMEKSFSGSVMDYITGGSWTEKQYFNLFEDMMLDQSAADAAKDCLEMYADGYGFAISAAEIIVKSIKDSEMETILEHVGIALDAGSAACAFALLFSQDNDTKLAMLDSLIKNYDSDEYSHLIMAARQVKQAYTNVWAGALYKLGYDFFYDFAADYSCLSLLDWLDIDYIRSVAQSELMRRFAYYEQLSDLACRLYVKKIGNYSNIFDLEALAMLYLYGVEQRYRAMAQHVLDNDFIDDFIADSINVYADAAEDQYAAFLAASAYADYDSIDDAYRSQVATEIKELFKKVDISTPASGAAITAEQGVFLAAIQASGMTDYQWGLVDLDSDNVKELLLFGRIDSINAPGCMVLDGEKLGVFNFASGDGAAALYRDSGSGKYYIYYRFTDGQELLEEYYLWQDTGWTKVAGAHHDPIYENHESPVLEYEKTFTLNGAASTESAYNAFVGGLKLVPQTDPGLSCPDLLDFTISGDPTGLMDQICSYINDRPGLERGTRGDLNGDGKEDRVYLLYNPRSLYTQSAQKLYCSGREYLLGDTTRRATLVALVDSGSGIRVRCMNVNIPLEHLEESPELYIKEGFLQMEDQYYVYREGDGQPFTRDLAQTFLGDMLYGRSFEDMDWDISYENNWPYGSPYGGAYYDCQDYPTEVIYGKIYRGDEAEIGVVQANFREYYPTVYELLPEIYPGMTTADFLRYVNEEAKPTNPKDYKDPTTGELMAQCKTCWYIEDTGWYYLVTAYLSKTNGTLLFADAELMKKPPINYFEDGYGIIPSEFAGEKTDVENLMDYCNMDYAQLQVQEWESSGCYLASDIWFYDCFLEGAHISFSMKGGYEQDNARPIFANINDCAAGIRVTNTLLMGKTYNQLAKDNELSELNEYSEGMYIAYGSADAWMLELIFLGDTPDSAVLMEVLCSVAE